MHLFPRRNTLVPAQWLVIILPIINIQTGITINFS
jgi:hypothetical protein